ncbi:hypothetical protein H2200_009679 [Cladophialophora chaetospira]|uniref:Uncharacterized protein n=1 Tax=Cladophialophora chaetospira TaxID=386627 RepID=A0AA38X349_9EURO|nr:hypothetical protein H2200_009679 [Cladophialophora chaetospira]
MSDSSQDPRDWPLAVREFHNNDHSHIEITANAARGSEKIISPPNGTHKNVALICHCFLVPASITASLLNLLSARIQKPLVPKLLACLRSYATSVTFGAKSENPNPDIEMTDNSKADELDEWLLVDRAGNTSLVQNRTEVDTDATKSSHPTPADSKPGMPDTNKKIIVLPDSPFTMIKSDKAPPTMQEPKPDVQTERANRLAENVARIPDYGVPPMVNHAAVHRELDNLWHHHSRYPELYDWEEWNALAVAICEKHGRDASSVRMQRRLKGVN